MNPIPRLRRVNDLLSKEIDVLTVQQEINTQARADIDRSQREYFLRQQLKAIQSELGEGNELFEEIEQYRDKILKAKMPENAEEEALRQLKKLERMHPDTAETATLRNWLDIMTDLPWSKQSKDNLNLKKAEKILDEDHYGLERVKERIVEALAVRKLTEKPKGSILCLVGPPGVGKTSLGRSVARALNRKFVRLQPRRTARRSRDPRPSPNLCRSDAGPDHPGDSAGGDEQSADHARRDRQGRCGFSRRSVECACSRCSIRNRIRPFATIISASLSTFRT